MMLEGVFRKLLISWDFYREQALEFTQNGVTKKKKGKKKEEERGQRKKRPERSELAENRHTPSALYNREMHIRTHKKQKTKSGSTPVNQAQESDTTAGAGSLKQTVEI